jgi:thymidylate kinase
MKRIFMLTTLGILLVMCLFSVALYMNIEQKMISYEYNNSNNLLQQIKFNIETVQGIIKDESVRTFFNSDVTNLMYMDKNMIDTSDYIERVNNITKDVVLDKFVYSVYLYNNKDKKVLPVINPSYTKIWNL